MGERARAFLAAFSGVQYNGTVQIKCSNVWEEEGRNGGREVERESAKPASSVPMQATCAVDVTRGGC